MANNSEVIKIYVNVNGKKKIFYSDWIESYNDFLVKCEDECTNVDEFFKYWIDDENDKVEINGERSYKMFLKIAPKKNVFIEKEEAVYEKSSRKREYVNRHSVCKEKDSSAQPTRNRSEKPSNSTTSHKGVSCDECNVCPIIGFRYKCLECPDFDLCMRCEGKASHCAHRMIRIPTPLHRVSNLNLGASEGCPFTDQFNDFAVNIDLPKQEHSGRRHHRYNRRHHSGNIHQVGTNVLTNLFQMMQGMAGCPNNTTPGDVNQAAGTEQAKPDQPNTTTSENATAPPPPPPPTPPVNNPLLNDASKILYDPETILTGVDILTNLGQTFSRMLYPLAAEAENLAGRNVGETNPTEKTNSPKPAEKTPENTQQIVELVLIEDSPPTPPSEQISLRDPPLTGEFEKITENKLPKQNSNEEVGWTLIDDEKVSNSAHSEAAKSPATSIQATISITPTTSRDNQSPKSASSSSGSINYAQLSKSLEEHLKEEQRKNQLKLSDVVHHKKPHINNAVIAMMAMGFSNDGQWLTHLLESVNGDIAEALNLLAPVK